jgi:hypothetical protein
MSFEIYWKLNTQEPLAFRLGSFSTEQTVQMKIHFENSFFSITSFGHTDLVFYQTIDSVE